MSSKGSTKKGSKPNTKKKIDIRQMTIPDYICWLYFIFFFGIYPIVTHNKYFDITKTRYSFFCIISVAFAGILVMSYFIQEVVAEYNSFPSIVYKEKVSYKNPAVWMVVFLLANIYALLVAPNTKDALTGNNGRFMGAWMYLVIAAAFIALYMRVRTSMFPIIIMTISSMFSYIVAIVQHAGVNFLGYKDKISPKQYNIFISTFGNINIFASFMVISLAVFMALYIFTDKLLYRIIAGIMIVVGGMSLMIANSDSAYIGVTAVSILLIFLSYREDVFTRFIETVIYIILGTVILVFINKLYIKKYDKRGGVAEALDNINLILAILVAAVVFYLIVRIIRNVYKEKLDALNKKKVMLGLLIAMILVGIAGIIACVITDRAIVKFNYRWGTFRGYIWSKSVDLFKNASPLHKLFGYGNETMQMLTKKYYYDEMLAVTKKVYDNAHNELLQYLVTTGIVGLVSYIGLFVSSFAYILKNLGKNVLAYISLAVMCGYFAQGLINLNQPITTPFFFVFMAIGVGSIRYEKWVEENDKTNSK